MNAFEELELHVNALVSVVDSDPAFFSAVNHYVKQFQKTLSNSTVLPAQSDFQLLTRKIDEFYESWRPTHTPGVMYFSPQQISDSDPTVKEIKELVTRMGNMEQSDFEALFPIQQRRQQIVPDTKSTSPCIFVGHGRSKLWARARLFLQDELGLPTVSYESESHAGESIVPVLERMLIQASFAILILTAEDETADGTKRARQNVIHEAGLFQGRLGFKKAILLKQEGIENFTNVDGLQYIGFHGDQIEQAFYDLTRVLKREGEIS
ncbi:TIR domain-containing protein [Desulfosporosinus lacus]|uniref:Predicted nucleotide-binding protein containing TIR-like domain-containing protein n=1 Tax=Desulfosporosinus lacus DSM 15449 TaxID=1121420 RepID=A0A1M5QPZ8_9FIRM|nr:nucleotide-binding protein [Desulfosporosinus lacus]SHH16207.1 Predicted nucleotide-binding protein containing TIR-like domain-containing protein [Desulfosporosinus lacus DSM 15449]